MTAQASPSPAEAEDHEAPAGRGPMPWVRKKRREVFFEPDGEFGFQDTKDKLRANLKTDDEDKAEGILKDATDAFNRLQDRVDGAERRATTLQGSSAVAASLAVAAAGLLVDPTKIAGGGWKLLVALTVLFIVFALTMCAWRATLASSRVHRWVTPGDWDVLDRPEQTVREAQLDRAVDLLWAVNLNQQFARYKISLLRAAADWIRRALTALLILALLTAAYAIFGPGADVRGTDPTAAVRREADVCQVLSGRAAASKVRHTQRVAHRAVDSPLASTAAVS